MGKALKNSDILKIKAGGKAVSQGSVPGLQYRPSATTNGHGQWIFRYVSPEDGKRKQISFGVFPDVDVNAAVKLASEYRSRLSQEIDPHKEKKLERHNQSIPTFHEAAVTLHSILEPKWKNPKHSQQWMNTLKQYAFPVIGHYRMNEIKASDIEKVLSPIWNEKQETASRLRQRIGNVFDWAIALEYCQFNPVAATHYLLAPLTPKKQRVEHFPAMPWRDIPEFIAKHIRNGDRYNVTRYIVEFVILTACRSGEARGMVWEEVDFSNRIWTIPAERMKAKAIHRIPLTDRMLEILSILREFDTELVFPSPLKQKQLSDMTLTSFLRKHSAHSNVKGRIATMHGFRSSFRDWCSETGKDPIQAERALAHTVKNSVEAAYHRTDLLDQRFVLMQDWTNFLGSYQQEE